MSEFLLILGVALLSFGLRSVAHPVAHRLGTLCLLGTSFLIGYFLTGNWVAGLICAASWLLLPWVEILTRVRHLRLPVDRKIQPCHAPDAETFPALRPLSSELEAEGFERVEDAAWEWEHQQHFVRIFHKPDEALQAALCLIDQDQVAFYYLSISSRGKDGTLWTTWNYPFSYSMQFPPRLRIHRVGSQCDIPTMLAKHRAFLTASAIPPGQIAPSEPGAIPTEMQADLEAQITHNLHTGLLLPADKEGTVRYSWRGLLYLWLQFLRDFVRFS